MAARSPAKKRKAPARTTAKTGRPAKKNKTERRLGAPRGPEHRKRGLGKADRIRGW